MDKNCPTEWELIHSYVISSLLKWSLDIFLINNFKTIEQNTFKTAPCLEKENF